MDRFTKKTAVITGAASGIGAALANEALRRGMNVVAADISGDELTRFVSSKDSERIKALPTDIRSPEDMQSLADFAYAQFGTADYLFNNAGTCIYKKIYEHNAAELRHLLDVNLLGIVNAVSAFLPRMRQQDSPGTIVNTASIGGLMLASGINAYCVTKHAVVTYSEALADELRADGIDVSVAVICPGVVDTKLLRSVVDAQRAALGTDADFGELTISASDVAVSAFKQLEEGRFLIITHPQYIPLIKERTEKFLADLPRC
jgi:NADP-dependent 3-hydroxy acid dehydrogenase YdfG